MKKLMIVRIVILLSVVSVYMGGCGDEFLDPTQIGRFRPVPVVNVILDSLGVAEETPSTWEGAEDPKPIDIMTYETDYKFSIGDIVRISIYELLREGAPVIQDHVVTETGKISIREVGMIEVVGLTESQLEEEIKQILTPTILKEPSVTVNLVQSQDRVFSILGAGVRGPGRYSIPRTDFRLTDALATAGGIAQFNVSFIYVSRAVTGEEMVIEPGDDEVDRLEVPEDEMLEIIAPRAQRKRYDENVVLVLSEMATEAELAEAALPEGFDPLELEDEVAGRDVIESPIEKIEGGRIEWIFEDGRWVPIQVGRAEPKKRQYRFEAEKEAEPLRKKVPEAFDWEQIKTAGIEARVIKIPADKLTGGDPRYNIIIRPGDSIQIPVDIIGEYFITGNTNNRGPVPLTGRPLTLKMAIATAGGLGPLAWPRRCEITRRIGKNREETVMVDLEKIAKGEQPDLFIKPLDLINVGTHPTARWRAVLRNAFRASYGFGFVYDRNFGLRDSGTSRPIPSWF